ncbi:MAG: hypothetical protein ACTSPB_01135 [Candidatus Thorarchaeota archaeon]
MKRLKVKKDVQIHHPTILVAEKGSVLRCRCILFGSIGDTMIRNETTDPKQFEEYFEILEELE